MSIGRAAGLSVASCILIFAACSSDDTPGATTGPDGGKSSSSGSNSASSSTGGNGSSSSSGGEPEDSGVDANVAVGDGSLGAGCNEDSQCTSKVCAVDHKCVPTPSCRPSTGTTPGVDTCGAAEPGGDSCCTTLTLPTTTTRTLDKYEITAGRIREFMKNVPDSNLQKWVKDFAASNPDSELGKMVTDFPGYADVIPSKAGTTAGADTELPLWLGAFPNDAINVYDGCYLSPGGYGAATYWQDPATLKVYEIGYTDPGDGVRKYPASVLDAKPANCMPPVLLAAFCAWDGGELARPSDYHEVWGSNTTTLPGAGGAKVTEPWEAILPWKQFNWRNGHPGACPTGWPGCVDGSNGVFYSFPTGGNAEDDDAPEIGAPGRFPKDVTKIVSPDGSGWFDLGGNLLEAAWPKSTTAAKTGVMDYCDTYNGGGGGGPACNRNVAADPANGVQAEERPGLARFVGQPPSVALLGASFEVHIGYGEAYFASATEDETKLAGYMFPAHFQYGKVGGRCARTK